MDEWNTEWDNCTCHAEVHRTTSFEWRKSMKYETRDWSGRWEMKNENLRRLGCFFFLTCLTEDKDLTPHLHLALARDAFELKWLILVEHDRKESVRWMLYSDTLTVSLSDLSTYYHLGNETGLKSQNILGIKPSLWNWNAIVTVQKKQCVWMCVYICFVCPRKTGFQSNNHNNLFSNVQQSKWKQSVLTKLGRCL